MKSIKPEKELEQQIKVWALTKGIVLHVYDSKAKPTGRGDFRAQGMQVGTPDLMGWTKLGVAVHVELKSPKQACIPSLEQRTFLVDAIKSGCFSVVVNSVELIEKYFTNWLSIGADLSTKKEYLLSIFPKKVKIKGKVHVISD